MREESKKWLTTFFAVIIIITLLVIIEPILTGSALRVSTACKDGKDNDGDSFVDYPKDTGCSSRQDTSELNPKVRCDDGKDNDGDGFADYRDAGCLNLTDSSELNPRIECDDGKDNDGDTYTDYRDAGCANQVDIDETNCGDKVCEGGETHTSCQNDCGPQDSCTDSDGGINPKLRGTVYGYYGGSIYNNTDFCNGNMSVNEYYCSGTDFYSTRIYCTNQTRICLNGACV